MATGEPLPADLEAKLGANAGLQGRGTVLLLGDSMLARFQPYGTGRHLLDPAVFENLAVGGSTTNHWVHLLETDRFDRGLLAGFASVVLCLGTNNLPCMGAHETFGGILRVVALLRERMPRAEVTFITVFPRWDLDLRGAVAHLNAMVAGAGIRTIDPDITDPSLFGPDRLHLTRRGYEQLAACLAARLRPHDRSGIQN